MSASLLVDLGNTCQQIQTIGATGAAVSGVIYAASGATIGQSCNMPYSDTYCNVQVNAVPTFASGQLRIQVQTAPADVSGQYTDPTSGLAVLPTWFSSGGILILNSGGILGGTISAQTSGDSFYSGACEAAAFQRPGQFARANVLSGDFFTGSLIVNFISQWKTTGSGGGFSLQPQGSGPGGPSLINV